MKNKNNLQQTFFELDSTVTDWTIKSEDKEFPEENSKVIHIDFNISSSEAKISKSVASAAANLICHLRKL